MGKQKWLSSWFNRNVHFARSKILSEDSPVKAWEKLNSIFGIKNKIWAFQLENELLTLDPSNFPSMEDCLSKFKTFKLLLEGCKITKEEEPLIYAFLLSYLQHTLSLYPPSSLLEKTLLMQGLSIELPPLIPFLIP